MTGNSSRALSAGLVLSLSIVLSQLQILAFRTDGAQRSCTYLGSHIHVQRQNSILLSETRGQSHSEYHQKAGTEVLSEHVRSAH